MKKIILVIVLVIGFLSAVNAEIFLMDDGLVDINFQKNSNSNQMKKDIEKIKANDRYNYIANPSNSLRRMVTNIYSKILEEYNIKVGDLFNTGIINNYYEQYAVLIWKTKDSYDYWIFRRDDL